MSARHVIQAPSGFLIEITPDEWAIAQDAAEQVDAEEIGHGEAILNLWPVYRVDRDPA